MEPQTHTTSIPSKGTSMKIICGKLKLAVLLMSVLFSVNAFITSPVLAEIPDVQTIAIYVYIYPCSTRFNHIADRIFEEVKSKLISSDFKIIEMACDVYYIDLYIELTEGTSKDHMMTFRLAAEFKINKCWTNKSKPPPRGFINGFRPFWGIGLSDPKKGTIDTISNEALRIVQEFIDDSEPKKKGSRGRGTGSDPKY
jgi:hypothetical protein